MLSDEENAALDREALKQETVVRAPGEPMPNVRLFLDAKYGHDDRCKLIQQVGSSIDGTVDAGRHSKTRS
jgi:hypothetical protein